MFTGIIEETGKVKSVKTGAKSCSLVISLKKIREGVSTGDSINTNGVCLTVTALEELAFKADVMSETMRKTTLGSLHQGDMVNLERALGMNSRLGGHLVTGHVDGTGTVSQITREDNALRITVSTGKEIMKYIIPKGSVAVDGVSLTVVNTSAVSFDVSLIPHTQVETTLSNLKNGDVVNIECDIVGRYIETFVNYRRNTEGMSRTFLDTYGF